MEWSGPILDNHLHLDLDRGIGPSSVTDFADAGGTHLFIVNKPSWWYGVEVHEDADFARGFASTVETAQTASTMLRGQAWAILGVHPALISRLVDNGMDPEAATELMQTGIDQAAQFVERGDAVALKTGRPHYSVSDAMWEASNAVMRYTFDQAAALDCAVQLHTESGRLFEDISTWAREAGLDPARVVKHYADGPIPDITPSIISQRDALLETAQADGPFLMETDFLDDPERPGAVLGPKTVPRRVDWLTDAVGVEPIERAHVETPLLVYGVDTRDTLAD